MEIIQTYGDENGYATFSINAETKHEASQLNDLLRAIEGANNNYVKIDSAVIGRFKGFPHKLRIDINPK